MALLDNVKTKLREENKIAMEEYDIISSLEEDEDIILEAAMRGEAAILGEDYNEEDTLDDSDIDEDDFASGNVTASEDPDLNEDDDSLDFSFESTIPSALESILNDDDDDDYDPMLDDEDMDGLFDKVVSDMATDEDEEDDF